MTLAEQRRSIQHLVSERRPGDALSAYYAFHHPDNRTQLVTNGTDDAPVTGYVAISRTGMDLFRPLVTMRFPAGDYRTAIDLIHTAFMPGANLFIHTTPDYMPIIKALFDVQNEQLLRLYELAPSRFQTVINVLVTRSENPAGLPRYQIRDQANDETAAWASLNWQSPTYADILVETAPRYRQRGYGQSVLAALVQDILKSRRIPLYAVTEQNRGSIRLAQRTGFTDTGVRQILLEATLRPRP